MKYVGSKNRISKYIVPILQDCIDKNSIEIYYEPFVGGGAMLYELQPKKAVINDYNTELMNVYECVKDENKFANMCSELNKHETNHSEEYYYEIRDLDRDKSFITNSKAFNARSIIDQITL